MEKIFKGKELSANQMSNFITQAKYADVFSCLTHGDINFDINHIKDVVSKENNIGMFFEEFKNISDSIRPEELKSMETIARNLINQDYQAAKNTGIYNKILSCYYSHFDDGNIYTEEEIFKTVNNAYMNNKKITERINNYAELVYHNPVIDKLEIDIIRKDWNAIVESIHSNPHYRKDIHISELVKKINTHHSIKDDKRKILENELDYNNIVDYLSENSKELKNILLNHLTMMKRGNFEDSFKLLNNNIIPLVKEGQKLDTSEEVIPEQGIGFFDFLEEYHQGSKQFYNISALGPSELPVYHVYDIIRNLGTAALPSELISPIKSAHFDVTEDEEEYEDFLDEFMQHVCYKLSVSGLELNSLSDIKGPFIEKNKFENEYINMNLDMLTSVESIVFDIQHVIISSKEIDYYIEKNIDNESELNKLLELFYKLLEEYCDDCFSLTKPKIVNKDSNLYPKNGQDEYYITAIITHAPQLPYRRRVEKFCDKKIHVCDNRTIEKILRISDEIEAIFKNLYTTK